MNAVTISRDLVLEPADNKRLANLCGQFDEHIRQIERRLNVEIASRGNQFRITGKPGAAEVGKDVIQFLFRLTDRERLDPERVHICLREVAMKDGEVSKLPEGQDDGNEVLYEIQTRRKLVRARGANQRSYLKDIQEHDLAFGIGPAGTGKTYLAGAAWSIIAPWHRPFHRQSVNLFTSHIVSKGVILLIVQRSFRGQNFKP